MHRLLKTFASDRRGNVAIIAALLIPVLAGGVGIAIFQKRATTARSDTQQALDAAVLAGATAPFSATAEERIAAAQKAFEVNITKFSGLVSTAVTARFMVNGTQVTGQAIALVKTPFSGLIGSETIPVGVYAMAVKTKSDSICVLALNDSEAQGFYMDGNTQSKARNCSTAVNSTASAGM